MISAEYPSTWLELVVVSRNYAEPISSEKCVYVFAMRVCVAVGCVHELLCSEELCFAVVIIMVPL